MDPLTYTVPDRPLIDSVRGFVAVAGALLAVGGPVTWWRLRAQLPSRILGLFLVLFGADVYITATELHEIGHRMLVWRLPLGCAVILGALVYIVRLTVAVANKTTV